MNIPDSVKDKNRKIERRCEDIEDLFSDEIRKTGYFSFLKIKTAPETRLAYLSDLRDFLKFLCDQNLINKDSIFDIEASDLESIKGVYVNMFLEALGSGKALKRRL